MPGELTIYTVDEVAEKLRVSRRIVYEAIKAGRLVARRPGGKSGGKLLVLESDLVAYLDDCQSTRLPLSVHRRPLKYIKMARRA